MAKKEKSKFVGFLVGPTIVFFALSALWKNETRFDYYRAAANTTAIVSIDDATENQLISHTGAMDQDLTIAGNYVKSFKGCLVVYRSAEIYCWDRDEDSDDHVTWSKRWMGSVESNSRNSGISQRLKSDEFFPPQYLVGSLPVKVDQIYFVDDTIGISPSILEVSGEGLTKSFSNRDGYFYLASGRSDGLGEERISYRAIPVPATGTYFGKFANGHGTAYDDEKRTNFINQMIGDSGVLHYLVAGERETALRTVKKDIQGLKWMVRFIGTAVVVFGLLFFFSSMVGFLFRVPVLGWIAEKGVIVISLLIGIPLAILTIACAYLAGHPVLLAGLIGIVLLSVYLMWRAKNKAKETQVAVRHGLDKKYGHELEATEIKELEFLNLANLALGDSDMANVELDFLFSWGKKHGWDKDKCNQLIEQAKSSTGGPDTKQTSDSHLQNLVELALADGILSPYEMRTIRSVASSAGFDRRTVDELMDHVQQTALEQEFRYQQSS